MDMISHPTVLALSSVLRDAGKVLGITPEHVDVASLQARVWQDGCLELGKPNERCPATATPGYLVVLDHGLRYHTDQKGNFRKHELVIECRDWAAWLSKEPPSPQMSLHVTGACTIPTPGYRVDLAPSEPQGSNPKDLLLDLVIRELPIGVVPDVLSDIEVRYDTDTETEYETVTIMGHVSMQVKTAW